MGRRVQSFVAVLAVSLMAVAPLFELFDRWDNIPETGNDTELTLVVIGACIGLCFAVASLWVSMAGLIFALVMRLAGEMTVASQPHPQTLEYEQLLYSPPAHFTLLRI